MYSSIWVIESETLKIYIIEIFLPRKKIKLSKRNSRRIRTFFTFHTINVSVVHLFVACTGIIQYELGTK